MNCDQQTICLLNGKIDALQNQVYQLATTYKQALSELSTIILPTQHKLLLIRGFFVLDSQGNVVHVGVRIFSNYMVQIDSNIDMTGLTLYLF